MTRPLRIEYPGAFYHITSRGNRKQAIFLSDDDRYFFLSCLRGAHDRFDVIIHAYCLMNNHYHLFAETPAGGISRIMHLINARYSIYFNKKHERSGHTFQSRFKAILVEAQEYARELTAYIHLNPVRAGLVGSPEEYEWSNYRDYLALTPKRPWSITQRVLESFGKDLKRAREEYRRFVLTRIGRQEPSLLEATDPSGILGSVEFIKRIRAEFTETIGSAEDREVPQARYFRTRPSPDLMMTVIEGSFGDSNRIRKSMAIWIAHSRADYSLKELADFFAMSISGISNNYRRMKRELETNEVFRRAAEDICRQLNIK